MMPDGPPRRRPAIAILRYVPHTAQDVSWHTSESTDEGWESNHRQAACLSMHVMPASSAELHFEQQIDDLE